MDWQAFWGGLLGSTVGFLGLVGIVLLWDVIERRRSQSQKEPLSKIPSFDDIFERQLEQHIIDHFESLFPGWEKVGRQYKTAKDKMGKAGTIDILCLDAEQNYVVIELKRGKASDDVVAQTNRYISWVQNNLVQPEQKIRGLIISRYYDPHMAHALQRYPDIDGWLFDWQLTLDKTAFHKHNLPTSDHQGVDEHDLAGNSENTP